MTMCLLPTELEVCVCDRVSTAHRAGGVCVTVCPLPAVCDHVSTSPQSWRGVCDRTAAGPAAAEPSGAAAPSVRGRRALELGVSPARQPAVSDRTEGDRSWPAPAATAGAGMMPWDTPPMRRPKPDHSLLKGERSVRSLD